MNKPVLHYINKLPSYTFHRLWLFLAPVLPDKLYLQVLYRIRMGYWMDMEHPVTFNEKLQWLKLHNRRPEYTTMVDKQAVKEYVANIIGKEHIIPTIGVWDSVEEIDFDTLPNQFVLKTTHGGGGCGVVICKNKATFDKDAAIKKLQKSLDTDIYYVLREWPYKGVRKRIIAEPYMTDNGNVLEDFKIHNFNGIPRFILLCRDRFTGIGMSDDFYTTKWEHLDVKRPGHSNPGKHEKPKELEEMLSMAERLSKDIPFIRTDFYTIDHKVYFGELTFYPASGMSKFDPDSYDKLFGTWLKTDLGGGRFVIHKEQIYLIISPIEEELRDYKFFCFNGEVKMFKIDYGRFKKHHANYYDKDGNLLPFSEASFLPETSDMVLVPSQYKEMTCMAEKIAKCHPFMRVDFYLSNEKIYFGEITFFPASGMGKFEPARWDKEIGKWFLV